LKDQLRLLKELQAVDSRAVEVRKQMTALPEKLKPAKADLAKLEALLAQARADLANTEKWKVEQQDGIKREEEAVRQARAKLQQSRNTRDFGAANREVENKRRSVTEREDELGKVNAAMEQTRTNIANNEAEVAKLREQVAKDEAEIAAKVAELAIEAEKFQVERGALTSQLPAELLKRYDTVQKRRGIALAAVLKGICQGCHMSLPPQLTNILARMQSLETCPNCQRLLFRPDLMAEKEAADAAAAGQPST
jgi:predicted  nucleic acid-binding Zn-ribbon protein